MTAAKKSRAKAAAPEVEQVALLAKDLAAFLADALLFASDDPYLPVLATIHLDVTNGKLRAVATDRYVIGVRRMAYSGPDIKMLLSVKDAADLAQLLRSRCPRRGRSPEVTLTVTDRPGSPPTLTAAVDTLSVTYFGVEGEFPKFEALIAKMQSAEPKPDAGTVALAPRNLTRFARLSAAKSYSNPLAIRTTGSGDGVQIKCGEDFIGFVMPVRLSEQPNAVAA